MNFKLKIFGLSTLGTALLLPGIKSQEQQKVLAEPPAKAARLERSKETSLHKPVLSEKGKEWARKHEDVFEKTRKNLDGGLIDASTFISESQRKQLETLMGKKGGLGLVEFEFKKLQQSENGYQYALDVDYSLGKKERWYISLVVYYPDQYPDDFPLETSSIAIWKGTKNGGVDKLTQNELMYEYLVTKSGGVNYDYLLRMIDEAKENRDSELKDEAGIKKFDFSKNKPVGYIGIIDPYASSDPFSSGSIDDVEYFPELMNSKGYNFVINKRDRNVIPATISPKKIAQDEIRAFLKNGVEEIYLNLSGHGNEGGVYLNSKAHDRSFVFTPRNLIEILNEFPNISLKTPTDACSGGGFWLAIKSYKDPSGKDGRAMAFVQSGPFGYNQEGRLRGIVGHADFKMIQFPTGLISLPVLSKASISPKAFSTYYNVFLYHYIQSGETYGMAHWLADQDAKKLVSCNAAVIKSTPRGGISTSMIDKGIRSIVKS